MDILVNVVVGAVVDVSVYVIVLFTDFLSKFISPDFFSMNK